MKILIISDQFNPSIRSSSILIQDLVNGLLKKKHQVTLITTTKGNNFKKRNLNVIRINSFELHGENFVLKGLNQIILFFQISFLVFFLKNKIDKLFIYSPPFFLGLLGIFFKKKKKIICLQDFFPQNAIDLSILRNKILIKILLWIEKKIFEINDYFIVHSKNSKIYIQKKHPYMKEKVKFFYNWFYKIPKNKSKKLKKNKKFKFIFGGSIGPSQNLEKIVIPFKKLEDVCELDVYGNGISKDFLLKKISSNNVKNIKIFKPVNNQLFKKKLDLADSALITLSNKNRTPIIPGKFNFYCLNSKNTTSIVNKESDLHEIIAKNKLGFSTDNQKNYNLTKFLQKIIKNKNLNKFNINAFKFAKKNFAVGQLIDFIEKI